jgi:hypothetical protein
MRVPVVRAIRVGKSRRGIRRQEAHLSPSEVGGQEEGVVFLAPLNELPAHQFRFGIVQAVLITEFVPLMQRCFDPTNSTTARSYCTSEVTNL